MNFLQLAQRLVVECNISGTGPVTVVSQTGEMRRVVNWIADAWLDIQRSNPDWPWLRKSYSFTTTTGQAIYTPAECGVTDLGSWAKDTARCYPTSVGTRGEMFLTDVPYDYFRNRYLFNAFRNVQTRPLEITVCPDTSLGLGPSPNSQGWTVIGDYFAEPTVMALDADVPTMPAKDHMVIVYRAMMAYGSYTASPEVFQRGEAEFNKIRRRMQRDRMPAITTGGALA